MCLKKKKTLNDGATAVSETSGEHIGWENQHVFYCFHGISVWLLGRNNSFLQLSWCSCRVWSCFWGDFREVGVLVASRLNTKRRGNNFVKQETSTVKGCGCGYRFTFIYCKNSLNYHHYIFIYIYINLNIINIYVHLLLAIPISFHQIIPNLTSSMRKRTPQVGG